MNTVSAIRNVAWYGTGHLGGQILKHLASAQKFNITLLVRREPASYKNLPSGVTIKQVDLSERSSLISALAGNDAVVVFTSMAPYNNMDGVQLELINAAIEAGVKFFVPSEWAPDTVGGNGATTFRMGPNTLPPTPIIAMKRVVHNYLLARSAEGKITFATLHTGNMLLNANTFSTIDVQRRTALLADGGHHLFSVTSRETLGDALINLLSRYPENKNSFLYICDGETSMYQVLQAVQKASGSQEPWDISSFSIEEKKKKADANLKAGKISLQEFVGVLTVPFNGPITVWNNPDNRVLGLEDPSSAKAQEIVDKVAQTLIASQVSRL
ncbi:NAD(P)-binding protein [Pyrenochaeta sp. DS3sAY3a]|nr:NAD(P)-binding protein [Pyrenochaeta sp. DS3sAY3a]